MANVQQSLSAEEELVVRFEHHWFAWFPMAVWVVLGVPSLGFTWWLALYEYLRLRFLEQGLTSTSVIQKKGILNRRSQLMALQSVENVEIHQGTLGRTLGFGTVTVRATGMDDLVFKDMNDPAAVKRRLEAAASAVA